MHVKSLQSRLTLCNAMGCNPLGSSVHGIFPGKNTGVSCHFLLQGIAPTQGSNQHLLCFLHWQVDSFPNKYKWKEIAATGPHGPEKHFSQISTDGGLYNPLPRTSHTPAANIPHASIAEASNFVELYSDCLFPPYSQP